MNEGLPWSVKGVEPDVRDDALQAALQSGQTLGQWLNGVIRDSLVDLKAARSQQARFPSGSYVPFDQNVPPAPYPGSVVLPQQQETARQTMQHYPGQQPYPYAPMPQAMPAPMMPQQMMPQGGYGQQPMPPYAMPQPPAMGYAPQPYPNYPAPPAPYANGYDPIETRLRQYARAGTETAVGTMPGQDQRVFSVIDAAVDAMQNSVAASEKKTAAAIDALASLVERTRAPQPVAPAPRTPERSTPGLSPSPAPAPSRTYTPGETNDADQMAKTLASLLDRVSMLQKNFEDIEARRAAGVPARQIESKIGMALDALSGPSVSKSADMDPSGVRPPARPTVPVAPPRPRASAPMSRGANAIAEIAARQRALDSEENPRASASVEASALDAIRRSIAALADQMREQRADPAANDAFDLRAELKELQSMLHSIAPRETLAAIGQSIQLLAQKIEQSRHEGVKDSQLAPIEKVLADMRVAMETMREPRALSVMSATLEQLARRVEDIGMRSIDPHQISEMQRQFSEVRAIVQEARQHQPAQHLHDQIARLSDKLDALAESPRDGRIVSLVAEAVEDVRRNMRRFDPDQIFARLDERMAAFDTLEMRIADLAQRIETAKPAGPDQSGLDQITRQIDRMTQSLAQREAAPDLRPVMERIDDLRRMVANGGSAPDLSGIVERIDAMHTALANRTPGADLRPVMERIDDLRRMVANGGSAPDLSGIVQRIDAMHAALANRTPGADLRPVMERIDDLRRMVANSGTGPELGGLANRIEELKQAIASQRPSAPDLSALERRITDIQTAVQQRPAQPDMKGLEQILRKLADRIESVRAPSANSASLDALQSQIVSLAERLEHSGPASTDLGGLERTLTDLVHKVGTLKETTVSAAERAVREAIVSQPAGGGMDSLAAEGMLLIKRDLTDMKTAQSEAESRSRETLQLVNTTLEKIVSRLSTLETELNKPRPASAPAVAAPVVQAPAPAQPMVAQADLAGNHNRQTPQMLRQAVEVPAVRTQAAAPVVRAPDMSRPMPAAPAGDFDLPLEPGGGRNGMPVSGPGEAALNPSDPRASFIAAARRAAQAAAAQTTAVLTELDEKTGPARKNAAAALSDGRLDGVKGFINSRRKPLLLGLAALVFAIGGMKVASNFIGGEEPTTTGSIASDPAAPIEPTATGRGKSSDASKQPLDRRQKQAEQMLTQVFDPAAQSKTAEASGAPALDKRLATAEQVMGKALPKMAMGQSADPMAVGSITAQPELAAPQAGAPTVDEPTANDLAAVQKAAPFTGTERLKLAATNGNLAAIYEVGSRMAEGRGVTRDLKGAAKWLEYAAAQGFAPAQYRFGSFNREGLGMQKDAKKAFVWFQRAAEQGHILAMHNLAVLYAEGVNGAADYASAASWFRTAAEHGVKDSQFNVGILYVRGLGVAQDMGEAYKWFAAAAAQGDPDAVKKRDEVAARLPADKLADVKAAYEAFRAKKPDPRANDVAIPEGGWDQTAAKAPVAATTKKTRT